VEPAPSSPAQMAMAVIGPALDCAIWTTAVSMAFLDAFAAFLTATPCENSKDWESLRRDCARRDRSREAESRKCEVPGEAKTRDDMESE
jgi:hypothetical protein